VNRGIEVTFLGKRIKVGFKEPKGKGRMLGCKQEEAKAIKGLCSPGQNKIQSVCQRTGKKKRNGDWIAFKGAGTGHPVHIGQSD